MVSHIQEIDRSNTRYSRLFLDFTDENSFQPIPPDKTHLPRKMTWRNTAPPPSTLTRQSEFDGLLEAYLVKTFACYSVLPTLPLSVISKIKSQGWISYI
jgi:hypothetical protein